MKLLHRYQLFLFLYVQYPSVWRFFCVRTALIAPDGTAHYDNGVTKNVSTRRCFKEEMQEYPQEPGTFVIMDVDHFKEVNNRFGHMTGDKVLHRFGEILHEYFREGDIVGRISGDEFVIFMRKTENREVAVSRIKSLTQKMENQHFPEMNGECVTISVGISFTPEHGTGYLGSVLLHLPAKGLPDMKHCMPDLPHGLRIYATYVMAHELYLKGEYGRALGLCDTALFFCEGTYPISMIYLYCMTAMCEISLKHQNEAQEALLTAWHMAAKDELLEPFIEHHGLRQGLLESCVRKENPEIYKKMSEAVIAFSRGWMAVHNPGSGRTVTDALTTMEFSIAMLACHDWSNQEIADHLGMSVNTVKHYISDIFDKLHVRKRDELKDFVLK